MKLVVFGLTVSCSWGNGHATLWRGLIRALAGAGHRVVFFERDLPFYAPHRDLTALPAGSELVLYPRWEDVLGLARRHLAEADVAMATSYCPDGVAAFALLQSASRPLKVFYDMDTPVTLAALEEGKTVEYLPPEGLSGFDLVLSFTGGGALEALQQRLGARRVAPLYGSVDPTAHRPEAPQAHYAGSLSYLGTYAADRQEALERLFLAPARQLPEGRFVLAGAQYPADFAWAPNVYFVRHLPPAEHPAFFCSSPLTLNVTRAPMAAMGWCPSGRLFEAAACGTAVLSDTWEGLSTFFEPGRELLLAGSTEEAVEALSLSPEALVRIGRAARERALAEHTAEARARQLLVHLEEAERARRHPPATASSTAAAGLEV